MRETDKLRRARGPGRAEQEGQIRVQLMPRARPAFVEDDAPVPGPHNDVRVIGCNEGFQGGWFVLRQEDQGVAAGQCRQIGDERVDVVCCGQCDKTPFGAEPGGQIVDAIRQFPVV